LLKSSVFCDNKPFEEDKQQKFDEEVDYKLYDTL